MHDQRAFASAWARFESFRENLPTYAVKQESITQYHRLLEELQAASGENLDAFKIPDDQIRPQPTGFRRASYSGRGGGGTRYTSDKRCDHDYFSMQMDGLWSFLKKTVLNDEPGRPVQQPKRSGHSVYVEHMYGSAIQQGSPGATVNISFQANDQRLANIVRMTKDSLDQIPLAPDSKEELKAEVTTIESQMRSPRPKMQIIAQSLHTCRNVLEGAAGSLIAAGIIREITMLLGG